MKGLIHSTTSGDTERPVWIIRHGQTKANKDNVIRGWWDLPLDDMGVEQACILGEEMKINAVELDGIISSDLMRSVQTSLEISRETGIPILGTSKSLRPWNVGDLTGTDGEKAHKIMSDYALNKPDEELPGGESFNVLRYRFLVGMIGFFNSYRGKRLGFVSHSRGERILHAWVAAGCPADLSIDLDVFLAPGEGTATAQELIVNCPLILP